MPVKRVSPQEALELTAQGYTYLDVRSVPEFAAGHPEGAYNIPLQHMGPAGMTPNPEFLDVVTAHFPKDGKIVVGCKSGGRSLHAAALLQSAGFTDVIDQRAGFEGSGEPGWRALGLPVSREAPQRTWDELKTRRG